MSLILLIEDDARTRKMLPAQLEAHGFQVDDAEDGRRGLARFAKNPPDLVLADMFMPEMDGLETIAELRRISTDIRIVAMSAGGAMAEGEILAIATAMGADATLSKPFSIPTLIATVQALLGKGVRSVGDPS